MAKHLFNIFILFDFLFLPLINSIMLYKIYKKSNKKENIAQMKKNERETGDR